MGTKYWQPKAIAVSQVDTVQITLNDIATTYALTINGISVSVLGNAGGVNATATDLNNAFNNSTHIYFAGITATVTTDTITMTGIAGLPFTITSSVSGGTGTIGAITTTTNATGSNDWANIDNWSGGILPVNTDDVIISDSATSILYGLNQSAISLNSLRIDKSFTGFIGLNSRAVTTIANGGTTDSTAPEYRDIYLQIGASTVNIGENFGQDNPAGSSRILLNLGAVASQITVHNTGSVTADAGRPALRLLTNSATTDLFIRSGIGGVGVAVDNPSETSLIGDITVSDTTTASKVRTGAGVTLTNWKQTGGINVIQSAGTIALVEVTGGDCTTEGDYTITTVNVKSGRLFANNIKTAGDCITTLNLIGGTANTQQNSEVRTINNLVLNNAGTFISDGAVISLTTITEPTGRYTLALSD